MLVVPTQLYLKSGPTTVQTKKEDVKKETYWSNKEAIQDIKLKANVLKTEKGSIKNRWDKMWDQNEKDKGKSSFTPKLTYEEDNLNK